MKKIIAFLVSLVCLHVGAAPKTWIGATGFWSDPAGWSPEGVPASGDAVSISSGTITITNAVTVASLSVTDGAELVAQAGASRLEVAVSGAFSIGTASTLSPKCDPETGSPVLFRCGTFTLAQGGLVNAEGAGFNWLRISDAAPSGSKVSGNWYTFAPGPSGNYNNGASHGGLPTATSSWSKNLYDLPYAPHEAGSPGVWNNIPHRGGGVVWIRATGAMTIYGTVNANSVIPSNGATGPSGGAIWLLADTYRTSVNARLAAAGSTTCLYGQGGGGGRISIALGVTDAEMDSLAAGSLPASLTYADSIPGVSAYVGGGYKGAGCLGAHGGDGTATLVTAAGKAIVVDPDTTERPVYAFPGGTGATKTFIGADDGDWRDDANWSPAGMPGCTDNVSISGKRVALTGPVHVNSLSLSEAATLTVTATNTAAQTDAELFAQATKFTVTGAMTVSGGSMVVPVNDPWSGAAVMFVPGSLTIDSNSTFDASGKGFAWYQWDRLAAPAWRVNSATAPNGGTQVYLSASPSTGSSHNVAPGYGGQATKTSGNCGNAYGNANAPFLPGSLDGHYHASSANCAVGGGTILIKSPGIVQLDGKLISDGVKSASSYNAATGGGIWVIAQGFISSATAEISAKAVSSKWHTQGPGGGRVCITTGVLESHITALVNGETPPELDYDTISSVSVDVSGAENGSGVAGGSGSSVLITGEFSGTQVTIGGNISPDVTTDVVPYGVQSYASGSNVAFSAPAKASPAGSDAVRYICGGYLVSNATQLVTSGSTNSFDYTIGTDTLTVTWLWTTPEYKVNVNVADHCAVAVNGVTNAEDTVVWHRLGEAISVEAVPEAGYEFVMWKGNVPVASINNAEITLTDAAPRTIEPMAIVSGGSLTRTFLGGDWNEPGSWDPQGVPGSADSVVIASGTLTLTNGIDIVALTLEPGASLVVQAPPSDGTLASLYGAALKVNVLGAFIVKSGATVRPLCDIGTGTPVFFDCGTFILEKGGYVNASQAGFGWTAGTAPAGAGALDSYWTYAPEYGSAYSTPATYAYATNKYAPYYPGSPGHTYSTKTSRGGGVVRINASGLMTIRGKIAANGSGQGFSSSSAGAIWLTAGALTVSGDATFSARGGHTSSSGGGSPGGAISVGVGLSAANIAALAAGGQPAELTYVDSLDGFNTYLQGGYIQVTALAKNPGRGATGTARLVKTADASITFEPAAAVPAPAPDPVKPVDWDGSSLAAKSFTGANGADWFDAANWSPAGVPGAYDAVTIANASVDVTNAVGIGSLSLTGTAALTVHARTSQAATWQQLFADATPFRVFGAMSLADSAAVYPRNDVKTGAPVLFEVGSLSVAENAFFDATYGGWGFVEDTEPEGEDQRARFMQVSGNRWFYALAGSTGDGFQHGPGYGGRGRTTGNAFREGSSYGYQYAPFLPGGCSSMYSVPSAVGGGTVLIRSFGNVSLAGTLKANGNCDGQKYTGSAGGGIWVIAKGFTAAPTALLQAKGVCTGSYTYGSGGGRISVATGLNDAEITALAAGNVPEGLTVGTLASVAFDVQGGKGATVGGDSTVNQGEAGTATYVSGSHGDTAVLVTGSPIVIESVSPYGSQSYEQGTVRSFSAPSVASPSGNAAVRYHCAGYVVSNETAEVTSGSGTSFSMEVSGASLTVYWLWDNEEHSVSLAIPEGCGITIGDETFTGESTFWQPSGSATVAVTADPGLEFLYWNGDFPDGCAFSDTIVLADSIPRMLRPVIRSVSPAAVRTYVGGDVFSAESWDPAGVPGLDDAVVVTNIAFAPGNSFACGSLALTNGATLTMTGSSMCGDIVLKTKRDFYVTDSSSVVVDGPSAAPYIVVGGDMVLAGSETESRSKFRVQAGELGSRFSHVTGSGFIDVSGHLSLDGAINMRLYSSIYDGGSVKITASSMRVGANAKINASDGGYSHIMGAHPTSIAPGVGYTFKFGGGYGGRGGADSNPEEELGFTYGQFYAPVEPGSPSGDHVGSFSRGGGLIRIHLAGKAEILGTLIAKGGNGGYGGASGGGIWVTASKFAFGDGAVLNASGNDSNYSGGGGGRIALWTRLDSSELETLASTGGYDGNFMQYGIEDFVEKFPGVTVNVRGGRYGTECAGDDGTFVFCPLRKGLSLQIR